MLDDLNADFTTDFDVDSLNIMPTANPEMSSRMQRIQRAQTMVLEAPNIALTGGDVRAIWESWFDAIGADDLLGKVFPDPEKKRSVRI